QVSLKRVVHRLQYVRRVGHIAQIHLFQVLLDFHGATDAPVVFGPQVLKSRAESARLCQIRRKRVGPDATDRIDIADREIFSLDDVSEIAVELFGFIQERIKAANELLATAIAAVQSDRALGAWQR
ncbi:MAG: hypothetical protein Q8M72_03875, partial [Methylocystis sp.]|nr:hypothetical protein [Methylocystis sp.]